MAPGDPERARRTGLGPARRSGPGPVRNRSLETDARPRRRAGLPAASAARRLFIRVVTHDVMKFLLEAGIENCQVILVIPGCRPEAVAKTSRELTGKIA